MTRRYLAAVVGLAALLALPAAAAVSRERTDSGAYVMLYDSGVVAAGAIITSPDVDTSQFSEISIVCLNSHSALRVLTVSFKAEDGTLMHAPTGNCALTARTPFAVGHGATGTTTIPYSVPAKLSLSLAALGAADGRIWMYGRKR